MPRILVLAPRVPTDLTNGVDLIALNVFPVISRMFSLSLVAFQSEAADALADKRLAMMFEEVQLVPNSGGTPEVLGWLAADLSRIPTRRFGGLDLAAARELKHVLAAKLNTGRYDLIHVRNLAMAPFAKPHAKYPRLLEIVDSLLLAEERVHGGRLKSQVRRAVARSMERDAICRFDACTTVSEADAQALRRHTAWARIEVVPNGVDPVHFQPRPDVIAGAGSIVFLGVMDFEPNIDAVRWLADAVLPLVRADSPEVTVTVVGRDPSDAFRDFAGRHGIRLTGRVPDVRPHLAEAMVFVAPMVSGSGIKNKVLEAMAMALPIVATTLAVEALEVQDGVHYLVADEASDFAAAIDRLLGDPELRLRLGQNARRLVETQYGWDTTARRYKEIYDSLLRARPRSRQ